MLLPSDAPADETAPTSACSDIEHSLSKTLAAYGYELYIPAGIWHNRNDYSPEKIHDYNENPRGLGAGKYRFDNQGDWHMFLAATATSTFCLHGCAGNSKNITL